MPGWLFCSVLNLNMPSSAAYCTGLLIGLFFICVRRVCLPHGAWCLISDHPMPGCGAYCTCFSDHSSLIHVLL